MTLIVVSCNGVLQWCKVQGTNLPRQTSVTLLNTVSYGRRAISHGKSAACNRTYYILHIK